MKAKVKKINKNLFLFSALIRFLKILKRDLRRSCEFILAVGNLLLKIYAFQTSIILKP